MGFGFLAPLLLGGAALIAVPWLVHQIRRPEPETVRFSSLLFVPSVERQIVERRRIQHPLLMLLRMLLLLLLATAFARPFRQTLLAAPIAPARSTLHAIALDISYSMAALDREDQARKRAFALLDTLPAGDRVAVVHFARTAAIDAPLFNADDPESGSIARARRSVARAQPTWEQTDYVAALQTAERLLLEDDKADLARVVHLVSDFQETGMPPAASNWRLASGIALDPIVIGREHPPNWAVEKLVVRPLRDDQVQIRARLRNWSGDADHPIAAKLVIDGTEVDSRSRTLLPGSASQIAFSHPWDGLQPLAGYVEIAADALTRDDRRYFALNPQQRHRVALVPERGTRQSYDRLVRAAVPEAVDLPWDLTSTPWSKLVHRLDKPRDKPRIIIAADLNDVDEYLEEKLQIYIRDGGHLFLPLSPRANAAPLNRLLGSTAGVRLEGTRFPAAEIATFAQLAWVDLEHRIFYAFRGARFNDFSALRFYNYHLLHCVAPAAVLARFRTESAESDPAIVEITRGAGSILLWAGGIDLGWSTLPKSPRFVPLLHETLHYLTAARSSRPDYTVGDPATLPMREWDASPPWQVVMPSPDGKIQRIAIEAGDHRHLELPGLLRWRPVDYIAEERIEAINIAAAESNPARLSPAEFALRLCDAPTALHSAADHAAAEQTAQREYGRAAVGLLFGLLLLESWYTTRLARQTDDGEKS